MPTTNLPPGKLSMVITYLEMLERPHPHHITHPSQKHALLRAESPTVSYYRYLYNTVGARWLWYERRELDDEALRAIVHDPKIEIYVLYVCGVPAGFSELDRRIDDEIELAYFGLVPEFLSQGLGAYLLGWTVDTAWQYEPSRLWVHTCNFDHPRAIASYQQAGFSPYDQEVRIVDDPRVNGPLAPGAGGG